MNNSQDAPAPAPVVAATPILPSARGSTPLERASLDAPADGSAARLAARISRVVRRRTAGTIQNLRVEVRRDGVFLDGQCASFYAKQLAQQAAMGLTNDKQLTNRIEVQ
ncbi:MAG TPA: BON domain-containing protein [Pirellulales bacterium]|nr:BON domain-containing protein [Pirellulales bacterium]